MDKQVQPSVHARLRTLEYAVQRLEEQKDADLRRIEQLAARVRELEMTRGDLEAERASLSVSLRVMVRNLDASMARVAELETALEESRPVS